MRIWLAFALIAALAGAAVARPPHVCRCREDVVETLPRVGATGVPTNARLWRVGGLDETPSQRIQVYELAPHTTYELRDPQLRFMTGDGPDETPPAQPTIAEAAISVRNAGSNDSRSVATLDIAATFDADTAVVRIEIDDHASRTTLYTTPDNLCIEDLGFSIKQGDPDVEITAIDLAGNASSPVTTRSTVDSYAGEPCTRDDAFTYISMLALAPCLLGLAYLIAMLVIAKLRARARRAVATMPLAITAAEELARSLRKRAVLLIVALGVATSLCTSGEIFLESSHDHELRELTSGWFLVLLVVFAVALGRWIATNHALRLTGYDGATATVCRDEVRITVGGQHATLRAAPSRVERAKEHGVPRATL